MASVSTAHSRAVLLGLIVAGALAGSAGGAAAQYYYDDDYGYEYVPRRAYGYRYGYREAPPPAPLSTRGVAEIAIRDYGLAQVERTTRTEGEYILDGRMTNGRRVRLILDRFSGDLVRRVNLQSAARAPEIARADPRDTVAPQPRLLPLPPERPASLKAPAQAHAPARTIPPAPAVPTPPVQPEKPADQPPVQASVPATEAPRPAATPAEPTPGATAPSGEAKPKLVNPNDVRGTDGTEHIPPLAKADPSGINLPPLEQPPLVLDDIAPAAPPTAPAPAQN